MSALRDAATPERAKASGRCASAATSCRAKSCPSTVCSVLSPIPTARWCPTSPPSCRAAACGWKPRVSAVAKAVEKKLFSRAAKARTVHRLRRRRSRRARRKGAGRRACWAISASRGVRAQLVLGFDNVLRALEGPKPPKVLIEAFDGARRRQAQIVRRRAPAGTELCGDRKPDQRRIGLGAGTRECDTCRRPAGRPGGTSDLRRGTAFRLPRPSAGMKARERTRARK